MSVPLCVDNVGAAGNVALNQLFLDMIFLKLSCSPAPELSDPAFSWYWHMVTAMH